MKRIPTELVDLMYAFAQSDKGEPYRTRIAQRVAKRIA